MAVKKTQMYRRNLDGTETRLNPLTEAQYVSMENGQTVQEVLSDRDSDKYTPVITNSSSTFKVGQGDNVDLSSSMKEGAYDSCVLKGKTMVNCIQEPSSQDVVLPYEFADGQYVTINDTKESGALGVELKGQTLVNLVPKMNNTGNDSSLVYITEDEIKISEDSTAHRQGYWTSNEVLSKFKTNTTYTVIANITENTLTSNFILINAYAAVGGDIASTMLRVPVNFTGRFVGVFETVSDFTGRTRLGFNAGLGSEGKLTMKNDMVILEGDWTNQELPFDNFFTGMTSCKMPTLITCDEYSYKIGTYTTSGSLSTNQQFLFFDCKPNTKYEITVKSGKYNRFGVFSYQGTLGEELKRIDVFKKYVTVSDNSVQTATGTTSATANLIGVYLSHGNYNQTLQGIDIEVLENGRRLANKSSILSLPEEVFLRDVNGVKDTFNTKTGIYTQRTKTLAINGTESWREMTQVCTEESKLYEISNGLVGAGATGNTGRITMISDKYVVHTGDRLWNDPSLRGVAQNGNRFRIRVSSNDFPTVDSLTQFLQVNPITVQYELATPIITKINPPSTLKSWNTTTHIYSEIPENTLYPILSHSNPTYPVILKPSTKYSIVVNSYSNSHTNSPINFNLGGATASTTVGNRVTTITTPSTLSNELLTMSGRGNKLNNVMVIEGDVVGDEPYFEGMCDSKSPILSNIGKNLFDINNHTENQWSFSSGYPYEQNTSYEDRLKILGDEIHFSTDGGTVNKGVGYYIPLCKNKDYTFRINKKDGNGNYCVKLFLIHSSEYPLKNTVRQHSKFGINNETIASSLEANFNSANYDMCAIYIGGGWEDGVQTTRSYVFNNISLTESNQQVEPYKSNTTTFDQKDGKTIVLRSLPNGVCDTLNVETGECVQNVVDIVLDGTENWILNNWGTDDNFCSFEISSLNNVKIQNIYKQNPYIDFYCDTFKVLTNCRWNYMSEKHIRQWSDGNRATISVIIPKSELNTYDVTGFIEYLTENNIRINIRANNPIVSTVDIQGFPHAYTNGHVLLSSGHSGQSLTPKVEYSLSANKTGQINSNTKRVSAHQKQLDDFEAMMLTSMVQSAYDKAILQFDYEMQMMSLGGE